MSAPSSRSESNDQSLSMYANLSTPINSRYSSHSASSFASSSSGFASRSSTFFARSTSPARSNLYGGSSSLSSPSQSLRFSLTDRAISPGRSISFTRQSANKDNAVSTVGHQRSRTCACSPTTHPGSFRCSLHRGLSKNQDRHPTTSYHSSSALNFRRSAMTNSLVRIGGVEGELVKRALTALIRPSSHQLRRRAAFQPRPSRFSLMSKAENL